MVIRYIKNLINEIVKLKRETIISDYIKGMERPEVKDKYLKRWIRNILSSIGSVNKELDNIGIKSQNISNTARNSPKKGMNLAISLTNVNNREQTLELNTTSNLESLIAYKNKLQQNYVNIFTLIYDFSRHLQSRQ